MVNINTGISFEPDKNIFDEYAVTAVDQDGLESFSGKPVRIFQESNRMIMEMEDVMPRSYRPYTNFSGSGFAETTQAQFRTR